MDYPKDFVEQLLGLSRLVVTDSSIDPVLHRVTELAEAQLDGCDMAGVTLVRDGVPTTAVFTHPDAPEIDRAQYDAGTGPCLDAYRDGMILRIDDTEDDDRWPAFALAARAHGIRSTLSLPLRAEDASIGALNLYSYTANAFADDEQMATVFVSHAAAVLATSQAYWAAQTLSAQLQNALVSRAVIEQAKGIVMREQACDADQAFEILRQRSQVSNRKLRDVAREVVDSVTSGSQPDPVA